jgi:23S rRNA (cytidine1920-2'-O)/16S rRNA (cytidine1409-2'-O)-methyltransferase
MAIRGREAAVSTAGQNRRADILLVERGFFESRARARAAIEAGLVIADGAVVRRPADLLPPAADIAAEAPHPYVSRGGLKLAHALDTFGIDPRGRTCLDVGASTGGFTDVLLERGAARVVAVDVGRAQLHPRLAADPRVLSLEGTDIRGLDPALLPEPASLATVDVSFISLRLVLPELNRFLSDHAQVVTLVKPQFEVGRAGRGRGGVVRDDELRRAAVDAVAAFATGQGWTFIGLVPSPITGGDGNQEFLLGAQRG